MMVVILKLIAVDELMVYYGTKELEEVEQEKVYYMEESFQLTKDGTSNLQGMRQNVG